MTEIHLRCDWQKPATPFRHTWEGLVNVDQFRWLVRRDLQDHLRLAHDELNARHVRAVGMLDDEMRVLTGDPTNFGKPAPPGGHPPRINWQLVDYVIDSLLDIGLSPMFTTSFMPGALASGERTVFTTRGRISPPKDPAAWASLVTDGVRHMLWRYGKETVRRWYFEVWNEPNLQNGFFEGTQAQFFELWKATWRAIKAADADLRIGGPSTARGEWLAELLEWTRRERCMPDYLIAHIYNNDSAVQPLSPFDGPQEDKASTSPHFAAGVVRGTRKLLDELGFKGEVHWNEWGRSWWPCFPDRETANEAAFVCKTMAEVSQQADRFAYWNLSDIYDQAGYGRETFHGNYGLLNLQGLRKPAWHAFQLLGRLGDERLPVAGTGTSPCLNALATRNPDAVLVYAYEPAETYARGCIRAGVTLPPGTRERSLRLYRVTQDENNILRRWEELGRPAYLRREETERLREANRLAPAEGATSLREVDGTPTIHFELQTPGVALLEIAAPA